MTPFQSNLDKHNNIDWTGYGEENRKTNDNCQPTVMKNKFKRIIYKDVTKDEMVEKCDKIFKKELKKVLQNIIKLIAEGSLSDTMDEMEHIIRKYQL